MNPLLKLAEIAESQVGVKERGDNAGPEILKYQAATWLAGQGWPWCAAFVCWCVQRLAQVRGLKKFGMLASELPKTPTAYDFEAWGRKAGAMVYRAGSRDRRYSPARGDIVIYNFSHIGIVTKEADSNGVFEAVEGNTNRGGSREGDSVLRKRRTMAQVRALVRIPLRAERV